MEKVKGYKFTTDWFIENLPTWEQYLIHLANQPEINVLEIGSWEGMSACWLLDNILTHESSRITCIDTFEEALNTNLNMTTVIFNLLRKDLISIFLKPTL